MDASKYTPGGGNRFSLVKFSDRLKGATKYGALKGSQENIMKIVRQSADKIRTGAFDSDKALKKFKSLDKEATHEAWRAADKIFQRLDADNESAAPAPLTNRPRPGVLPDQPHPHRGINRDPNFQVDYQGLSVEQKDGGRYAVRGQASRAAINYDKMSKLGGSESARNLQKDAFNKLQQSGGGLITRR